MTDQILIVKGRVDHKEGETKLIAMEVSAFEAIPERHTLPAPLRLEDVKRFLHARRYSGVTWDRTAPEALAGGNAVTTKRRSSPFSSE